MTSQLFWRALRSPLGAWIIADLGQERIIKAIRTGTYDNRGVRRYNISISSDGEVFNPIRAPEGGYSFVGNVEAPSIVVNPLPFAMVTRYVRLTVEDVLREHKMRWGIDGCTL